jgi:hypothetical protein
MGVGPIAMAAKPMGWGAEVLRRYKLLGGTPQTLNHTLINQAAPTLLKDRIVSGFKAGTDIAAPPGDTSLFLKSPQQGALDTAGKWFDEHREMRRTAPNYAQRDDLVDKDFFESMELNSPLPPRGRTPQPRWAKFRGEYRSSGATGCDRTNRITRSTWYNRSNG